MLVVAVIDSLQTAKELRNMVGSTFRSMKDYVHLGLGSDLLIEQKVKNESLANKGALSIKRLQLFSRI